MENDKEKLKEIEERFNSEVKESEKKFIDRILNTTDEDIAKMSFKEKQQFFKDKKRIVKVVHKGGTYVKPKEAK